MNEVLITLSQLPKGELMMEFDLRIISDGLSKGILVSLSSDKLKETDTRPAVTFETSTVIPNNCSIEQFTEIVKAAISESILNLDMWKFNQKLNKSMEMSRNDRESSCLKRLYSYIKRLRKS